MRLVFKARQRDTKHSEVPLIMFQSHQMLSYTISNKAVQEFPMKAM